MSEREIFVRLLNNLFLSISKFADSVPLGGKEYVDLVSQFYGQEMFRRLSDHYNPASNKPIDLCRGLAELMDNDGIVDKNDYIFTEEGDSVNIKVNQSNCTYYEYCSTAKENNLPTTCCRMNTYKWVVSKYTERHYQLKTDFNLNTGYCEGIIYPGEAISEILTKDGDRINVAGERAIVITTKTHGTLLKAIYDYAPHLLERILFESTYYASLDQFDKLKPYFHDSRELIEHLLIATRRAGSISYEIMEYDEINKSAVIRGYGSYIAEVFRDYKLFNSPKASCAAARGRLAAYFTKAWGEEIVCEEMKCEAFGDDYCEFILIPEHISNC